MPDPFISSDAASVEYERTALKQAVRSGDRRAQLEAIRDYIAHELEANLCGSCKNSKLRTGDQASLILRLQTVLAEIDALPSEEGESRLGQLRRLSAVPQRPTGTDGTDPTEQRRTGSRRPGGGRK